MNRSVTVLLLVIGMVAGGLCRADTYEAPASNGRASTTPLSPDQPFSNKLHRLPLETQWGGLVRTAGTASRTDRQSSAFWGSEQNLYDGFLQFRLKNDLFLGSHWTFQTHYEAVAMAGDILEISNWLREQWPDAPVIGMFTYTGINDDYRLMDLTHVIHDDTKDAVYHRLDRLNLTLTGSWGMARLGRQALTWGNGLVFHPMDLFNPFAPTAVVKEYKTGDDMALIQLPTQWPTGSSGNLQALYLPRRDPATTEIRWDQSSLAGKWHLSTASIEVDALAAHHFEDTVLGIGAAGFFREAAWRTDLTWTFLEGDDASGGYLSAVANMDYAWNWWDRNCYGLLEIYFNGLGTDDYGSLSDEIELMQRIERGELFVIGRIYLAGEWQIEIHPLVRFSLTTINNLADPSGRIQPLVTWDVTTDLQLIAGFRWNFGGSNSEYGGFELSFFNDDLYLAPNNSVFMQLTCYF